MVNKSIGPLQDAQEAIRIVHDGTRKNGISTLVKSGSWAFRLEDILRRRFPHILPIRCINTATQPVHGRTFQVPIYPVISMDSMTTHRGSNVKLLGSAPSKETVSYFSADQCVSKGTPPAFIVQAADDKTVPPQNSIAYFLALNKYGIPCELHMYESGGHGFGLGRGTGTTSTWPETFKAWLQARGIL